MLQSESRTCAMDAHTHASKSRLAFLKLSKSESCKTEVISTPTSSRNGHRKILRESLDDSAKLLRRSKSKMEVQRQTRSTSTSPSAWALSPGRSLHPQPITPQPFSIQKSKTGGSCNTTTTTKGVSGVLKYFSKKKKVSYLQEEEYHQFRIMHNRLLQWRFSNARAEVSMTVLKRIVLRKLFTVWLKTSKMRKFIVEKRFQMQKFKRDVRLYNILSSEITLLKEWAPLESKNCEAVGRLARKLSAISVCLPLDQGSKADITSFHEEMEMATKVMDDIEAMITNIQAQVEQTCYMLTELSVIVKEGGDCSSELDKRVATVASLAFYEALDLHMHVISMEELSIEKPLSMMLHLALETTLSNR
ncbi:hypothetical protein ACH5RR_016981 [Cinchona calisaya]|uniref:QWRF motif-containing protein 7 n=1 Tax=Cinchona calisaya TaxID=153742 RepID=A0ABD3A158_9GENT